MSSHELDSSAKVASCRQSEGPITTRHLWLPNHASIRALLVPMVNIRSKAAQSTRRPSAEATTATGAPSTGNLSGLSGSADKPDTHPDHGVRSRRASADVEQVPGARSCFDDGRRA